MVMQIRDLVAGAFKQAWDTKENIPDSKARSSYFVSRLADAFSRQFKGKALVQVTDKYGNRVAGEWLLDVAIVSERDIGTEYKGRKSKIVDKLFWAIESEFSTSLHEFAKDFSKLLHIKSECYLYVAGLDQSTKNAREAYLLAQTQLARSLINEHLIDAPFYIAFVPTPGQGAGSGSVWDKFDFTELMSWLRVEDLSSRSM